jgi:ribosomal protein S18 acetylase RimI-like enzyme
MILGGLRLMAIQIHFLNGEQLADKALQRQLGEVYQAAFAIQEAREGTDRLMEMLEMHRGREGFRCVIAQEDTEQRIVGFAYGYTSRPGYWWFDTIAHALSHHAIEIWFENAFEVVELAVHPKWQRQDIGGRVHDALLEDLPHSTAVLSTDQGETNAMHLYRKRGWVPLLEDFYFPNSTKPMMIMGLDLEARTS